MNWLTTLFNGGDAIKEIGGVVSDVFTNDDKREKQLETMRAEQAFTLAEDTLMTQQNVAQTEVNKVEAGSGSLFIAGWRASIGWVGAIALFYQFVLYPLLLWLPLEKAPPLVDSSQLYPIIMGMLGIGAMRSYDKKQGTDTKSIK